MSDTLLIIEDEPLLGDELRRQLARAGWDAHWVQSVSAARSCLNDGLDPLIVLADLCLPDGSGLDLLESLRNAPRSAEWIFLTGHGTIPDSVQALRAGAYDFLTKPCEPARLELSINGAARSARAQRRLRDETQARTRRYSPASFVGSSRAATQVRGLLEKLGPLPVRELVITGETGTGKGLAARILHHSSPRGGGPLVEVNCAALPVELLESELFGHEAGAFTGARARRRGLIEQADSGTLFLDEIGEMNPGLQVKLLKVLEDHRFRRLGGEREVEVDIRVIAASNRDLLSLADIGAFRIDLLHRLSVFHLPLPPLRDRLEDLTQLVPMLVEEFSHRAGRRIPQIPEEMWIRLGHYRWPGNVRELRNVIERCVLLSSDEQLDSSWLQLAPAPASRKGTDAVGETLSVPLDGSMGLEDMDRYIIEAALRRHAFNVTAAARALRTTRETLRYRIRKYGLHAEGDAEPQS